jgi:hypothetical protein
LTLTEAVRLLFDTQPTSIDPSLITRAFRNRVKQFHPDLNPRAAGWGNMGRLVDARNLLETHYNELLPKSPGLSTSPQTQTQTQTQTYNHTRRHARMQTKPSGKNGSAGYNTASSAGSSRSTHVPGYIPRRTLRFGQYLYYSGVLTWDQLIAGLLEQRTERVSFGKTARNLDLMSASGLKQLNRAARPGTFIGQTAEKLGLISPAGIELILMHQRRHSRSLGQIFVDRGWLTQEDRVFYLSQLRLHNHRHSSSMMV